MRKFFIKNVTDKNVGVRLNVSPNDELGNLGHEAAVSIEGGSLTMCLSPEDGVTIPQGTVSTSEGFDLPEDGIYAIEINGVLQPHYFTPAKLLEAFNGKHPSKVKFSLETNQNKITCEGATNQVSLFINLSYRGESGGIITVYDDDTDELISDVQGYYLNYPENDISQLFDSSKLPGLSIEAETISETTDYEDYHTTRQLISYRNHGSSPVRLRIEVTNTDESLPESFVVHEMEFHHNPTFNNIEEQESRIIYGVCLAASQ